MLSSNSIGNTFPAMNFVSGTVKGGAIEVPGMGQNVSPEITMPSEGTDVIVGLRPEHATIDPNGDTYTYADALDESARLAVCLSDLGLKPGNRVTVQVEKSPMAVWLYLACLRAGFVFPQTMTSHRSPSGLR